MPSDHTDDPLAAAPPRGDKIMAPADTRVGPRMRAEAWEARAEAMERAARLAMEQRDFARRDGFTGDPEYFDRMDNAAIERVLRGRG